MEGLHNWCVENKNSNTHFDVPFMYQYKTLRQRYYNLEENINFITKFIESFIEDYEDMRDSLALKLPQIPTAVLKNSLWESIDEDYVPRGGYLKLWETTLKTNEYPFYVIANVNAKENEEIEKYNSVLGTTFIIIRNRDDILKRFKQTFVKSRDINSTTIKLYSVFEFSLYIPSDENKLRYSTEADFDVYTKNEIDQSILTMANEIILRLYTIKTSLLFEYEHAKHVQMRALDEYKSMRIV